ncbi:hypothetical protein FRE64_08440 [Euhalothece natronophila Z-M001]|uniref:Glycine zipper domain-containing protein n=1 Tax=Euhalothece natronophila Z-M001 TaxID=522448 RepID=A0A5B8NLS1_9CHRO|nr:hypothetical protein [Euhalothece natronophila]QDZ39966.1 hypothetical protein FRE64_08440 [Euhalothece natronophila Z-M001]
MSKQSFLKRGTATVLSLLLGIGVTTPLILSTSVSAQLLPGERRGQPSGRMAIPEGTSLPVKYDEAENIVVMPDETAPITLEIAANIKNQQGRILIPYGTELVGEIQPSQNGSRFVAEELKVPGESPQSINASSQVVTRRETIRRGASTGSVLEGAAIGAAAATVLSGVLGDQVIATEKVLGGAALGAIGGLILGRQEAEVISIDPNTDLDVTVRENLDKPI